MSDPINIRRLWCLKTRGYHVFPAQMRNPNWVYDPCISCGLTHSCNRPLEPYTYLDDLYVYSCSYTNGVLPDTATSKHDTVHLRSYPNLTDLQEHD